MMTTKLIMWMFSDSQNSTSQSIQVKCLLINYLKIIEKGLFRKLMNSNLIEIRKIKKIMTKTNSFCLPLVWLLTDAVLFLLGVVSQARDSRHVSTSLSLLCSDSFCLAFTDQPATSSQVTWEKQNSRVSRIPIFSATRQIFKFFFPRLLLMQQH